MIKDTCDRREVALSDVAEQVAVHVAAAVREVSGTRPAGPDERARHMDLCVVEDEVSFVDELVSLLQHCL